jgi:hypothetical protein
VNEFDRDVDALLAFPSERHPTVTPTPEREPVVGDEPAPPPEVAVERSDARRRPAWKLVLLGALLAAIGFAAFELTRTWPAVQPVAAAAGGLTVDTQPAGATVRVDGKPRGVTPLTLSLAPGTYTVDVRLGDRERSRTVTIVAGSSISQYFELVAAAPLPVAVAVPGTISIATNPAGARVSIDGRVRGFSPLTVTGLEAGDHRVAVQGENGRASRVVSVDAGGTASVMFTLPAEIRPAGGWLALVSPFEVRVFEGTEVIGTSATARIMLTAGRHEVRLVNSTLEFSEIVSVDISAGQLTMLRVDPPRSSLDVNAEPWAEVRIDDTDAGQTPIANLPVTLGTHHIVFRHPDFGERRQTIVVTAKGPHRISMDMTR